MMREKITTMELLTYDIPPCDLSAQIRKWPNPPPPVKKKFLTKNGLVWMQLGYNSPNPNHIPTFCHSQQQPTILAI